MKINLRSVLFAFILAVIGCGDDNFEDYSKFERERSELVVGLVSYMTPTEALEQLLVSENDINVTENNLASSRPGRAPFHLYSILVPKVLIGDRDSSLELKFFNNRLMEVRLSSKYLNAISSEIPELSGRVEGGREPYTRIWIHNKNEVNHYIGFSDTRLRKQVSDWINRNT